MPTTEIEPEQIEAVIAEALEMYRKERAPLDPSKGSRDFLEEAEEELLYVINSAVFQVLKIRRLRESWTRRVKLWGEEKKLNNKWQEEAEDDPEKAEETRLKHRKAAKELVDLSGDSLMEEIDKSLKTCDELLGDELF